MNLFIYVPYVSEVAGRLVDVFDFIEKKLCYGQVEIIDSSLVCFTFCRPVLQKGCTKTPQKFEFRLFSFFPNSILLIAFHSHTYRSPQLSSSVWQNFISPLKVMGRVLSYRERVWIANEFARTNNYLQVIRNWNFPSPLLQLGQLFIS